MTVQYAEMVMKKSASYIRGMKEHGHLRGEDQCLRVLANAYEVTGKEKYRQAMEYFIRHQCEGLKSMRYDRLGNVVRTCTGGAAARRFYFAFYKQQALSYVYDLTRDPELLEAMTHGYRTYFSEGLLGSGFASLYQGTGDRLYARLCALSLRHAAGHAQREVTMPEPVPNRQWCKSPTVMGTLQSNIPYAMAAVYRARLRLHPRDMVGRQFDSYALAEPAGDCVAARTDRVFSPIDLSAVANRDGQSLTYCSEEWGDDWPVKRPGLRKSDIAFDFGVAAMHTPGTLPVTAGHKYPATRMQADRASSFSGLPFGAELEVGGVPFTLIDPVVDPGRTVLVLRKGQKVVLPVGGKALRAHFFGHVCGERVLDESVGVEYVIHYRNGVQDKHGLRNCTDYRFWHYPWYLAERAAFAGKYGPYLLNRYAVDLRNEDLESIEIRDTGLGHGFMLLAITLEREGRTPRHWDRELSAPDAFREATLKCSAPAEIADDRVESENPATVETPCRPGRYLMELALDSFPVGAAVDVSIAGEPILKQFVPLGMTTLRKEIEVRGDALRLGLKPYDFTHKVYKGKGRWKLKRLALQRIGDVSPRPAGTPKPLVYGWNDIVLRPEVHQAIGAARHVEEKAHYPLTDDGLSGRKSATGVFRADVNNGRYDVILYLACHQPLDLVIEGQRFERVQFPHQKSGDYEIRKIFEPFTCRTSVTDGHFDLEIHMPAKYRYRAFTWEIMGLILRPVE